MICRVWTPAVLALCAALAASGCQRKPAPATVNASGSTASMPGAPGAGDMASGHAPTMGMGTGVAGTPPGTTAESAAGVKWNKPAANGSLWTITIAHACPGRIDRRAAITLSA